MSEETKIHYTKYYSMEWNRQGKRSLKRRERTRSRSIWKARLSVGNICGSRCMTGRS